MAYSTWAQSYDAHTEVHWSSHVIRRHKRVSGCCPPLPSLSFLDNGESSAGTQIQFASLLDALTVDWKKASSRGSDSSSLRGEHFEQLEEGHLEMMEESKRGAKRRWGRRRVMGADESPF